MAIALAQDEIDGGGPIGAPEDGRGIDAFLPPELQEGVPAHILSHRRDIADAGSLSRSGDSGVGGVAAKSFLSNASSRAFFIGAVQRSRRALQDIH